MPGGRGESGPVMRALGLDFGERCPACGANNGPASDYCRSCGLRIDASAPAVADPKGVFLKDDVYLAYAGWPLPSRMTVTRSREQWMIDVRVMAISVGFVCLMLCASCMYLETMVLAMVTIGGTAVAWMKGRAGARGSR